MAKNASSLNSRIWLSAPHMSGNEEEFINNAFTSNWIAPLGPNVDGFELALENYLNHKSFAVALTSGTAAIHLALVLLDIGKDDEVICQTKTFVASVNPVIYLGAKPVFVDSEMDTWNMCPELLEKTINDRISKGKKPKAIIAINLYGMPYNVDRIHTISEHYNIPIVEDSAEALGSKYNNKPCGTFGALSILSFNGNKIITTSGGGALITRDKNIKKKAVFLATQAKDEGLEYSHSVIGYNYRMSNILAGIGRGQMTVIDDHVTLRRRNFDYYLNALNHVKHITFLNEPERCYSNRWLTCVLFENEGMRNDILNLLNTHNIEARPSWKPMHQQDVFKEYPSYENGNANELHKRGLCLPSGSSLTETDLKRICSIIKEYFG